MATFYLNYATGSDAASGADWANAWKTLTLGATAARIAPGDIIRIAKSPAPTSLGVTGVWTNLSSTVTLASALTAVIEDCEDAWVASANVTATTSTTNKEGTNSCSLAIAAGFTTGKVAYEALAGSTDFSGYQQVSFWIRSSVAISAGVLTLDLCSDTIGATSVNSIAIPAIPGTARWQVVTVDTGGALGAAIQSISINAVSDPGTPTILIDNIIACKASSSADSLTLSSLISKNSAEQGGTEAWYGIQSINGTTVILDADTNTEAGVGRGYSGTTETVTTYKRETIKTTPGAATSTVIQEVMDSGTLALGNIQFQGGYDTGTGNQTGETFFDGQNGNGYGIYINGKSYTLLNYINTVRYYYGVYYNTSYNNTITTLSNANNNNIGVYAIYSNNNTIVTLSNANNNASYGVDYNESSDNTIKSLSTTGNATAGIFNNYGRNYISNALIAEATEVAGYINFINSRLFSNKHDQTADNHWIFTDGGTINSQTTVRHTASGVAWKFAITSANRASNYPLNLSIAKIAVTANNLVTVKVWVYKDNATTVGAKLVCRGGQIAGVTNDVTATAADVLTTWEELTITFTPTEAGVVEIEGWGYYISGNSNVYFDDITITQV